MALKVAWIEADITRKRTLPRPSRETAEYRSLQSRWEVFKTALLASPISRDEITPRLEQYKKATQNPRVLIAGDSKAKFGFTVYALDQVRKAGIDQVSVETRVRKTGE